MKVIEKNYNAMKDAIHCMESPIFEQVLKLEVEKLLQGTGIEAIELAPQLSQDLGFIHIYIRLREDDNEELQVWLMSQKDTGIDNDGDLGIHKLKRITFVTPAMVELRISLTIYSKLSEDDLMTLDLLGKGHRKVIPAQPARVETSIYCEV